MDDDRVWAFERNLWSADEAFYRDNLDDEVIMVMPAPYGLMDGEQVIAGVSDTPRWSSVDFSDTRISRIQHGLLVAGYRVHAAKDDGTPDYDAYCTTTYRLDEADKWWVIQHQQTPVHHQAR